MRQFPILVFLFQLAFELVTCKFCCDHEFQIEREYCEPLSSTFEFRVLSELSRSTDRIEYSVEVTRNFRGIFQAHTQSVLLATRHYCVPEIKLHPNRYYLGITRSLRINAFVVDNCFFEQVQFAYPKVRDRQLLCMSYDTNASIKAQLSTKSLLFLVQIWHLTRLRISLPSFFT